MAVVKPVFFDTSILLGGLIDLGPEVESAQGVMAAIAEVRVARPVTAWHCCLEFYSVATRLPPGYRISPQNALLLMEEGILNRFEVHQLPEKNRLSLLQSAASTRVAGARVYDVHIGAIALESGATALVTENVGHFSGLPARGVDVLMAGEFLLRLESLQN